MPFNLTILIYGFCFYTKFDTFQVTWQNSVCLYLFRLLSFFNNFPRSHQSVLMKTENFTNNCDASNIQYQIWIKMHLQMHFGRRSTGQTQRLLYRPRMAFLRTSVENMFNHALYCKFGNCIGLEFQTYQKSYKLWVRESLYFFFQIEVQNTKL
jgi:hypothetical protein